MISKAFKFAQQPQVTLDRIADVVLDSSPIVELAPHSLYLIEEGLQRFTVLISSILLAGC